MKTMEELEPCPFCGCPNITVYNDCDDVFYAECCNPDCDAFGPSRKTEQQAIDAWNRREK